MAKVIQAAKGSGWAKNKTVEVLNARQTSDGGGEENEQRLHKVRKAERKARVVHALDKEVCVLWRRTRWRQEPRYAHHGDIRSYTISGHKDTDDTPAVP